MKPRSIAILLAAILLPLLAMLGPAGISAAQDTSGRVQSIAARLGSGESQAYLLQDLKAGDRLAVSMQATSGDLDPIIGILDASTPLAETMTRYQADVQRILSGSGSAAAALEELRNQYFIAWDDDSGAGYAADLAYTVAEPGDYVLIAGSSLSALGRTTAGDYELLIELNAPAGAVDPMGAPIAEPIPNPWGLVAVRRSSIRNADGDSPQGKPEPRRLRRRTNLHCLR